MPPHLRFAPALLMFVAPVVFAQPTDARIRADLMSPGVLEIRFTRNPGTLQRNSDTKVFEFVRGVEVLRKTEMPGVKLLVVGDAVYQQYPSGFRYWKFRVLENRYDGIPNPSDAEIAQILRKDPAKMYGGAANVVLAPAEPPRLASQPEWTWHTPNSVSFLVTVHEKKRVSYTEIEIADQDYEVRLYRDAIGRPWTNFIGSPKGGPGHRRVLGKKSYSRAEMAAMKTVLQASH
jgi:hypothetical protein